VLFVPAKYTAQGVLEAMQAGLKLILTISEHVPVQDMMKVYHFAKKYQCRVIGPIPLELYLLEKPKPGSWLIKYFLQDQ
jgi:succinyl-CoA synthetase alpha subunit